jgi:antitoxin (DNA-binding transcriptional repressor) of toxin-antitoxin stability system
VIITVAGEPRARLTRPPLPAAPRALSAEARARWLEELAELRRLNDTGKHHPTVEEILAEDRADR